jgi:O-antigen/teichoic acid export membrane protein
VWAWPRLYREEGAGSDARRVAKNALTPILLNLFTKGILFALTFVSLRVLGPAGAGDYTYAVVIWGWFDIFTNFGLNTFLTREVARHKDQAGRTLTSTTLLRLGLAALGIPALAGFIAVRQVIITPPLNAATVTTMWLLYAGLFFSTISTGLTALFYAFEKAEFPAAIQTISAFLTAGLGISALLAGYGIIGLAAVSITVNAITLAILGTLAVRMFSLTPATARLPLSPVSGERGLGSLPPMGTDSELQLPVRGQRRYGGEGTREALRESFPLMINHLLATLFFRIDVVLLEAIKGATVVGWYRVVYTWVDAIGVIPSFFTLSLFPIMSRQAAEDRPALRRAYILAIKLMTLLSIPTAIFTTLLATFLVNVLGGPQYLPNGAIALQIFIWAMIVGWMNSVTQYVIIALNRQRTLTIAFVVGAAFNITTNLIFIPRYSYVASSVITILSEMVLWVVFYAILVRDLGRINWGNALWRIAAAGIACAGATFGLAGVNIWLGFAAGLIIYAVALVVIRPLDAEESRLFMGMLPEGIRRRLMPSVMQ